MTDIREYLARKPLLFDGGMGTYYKAAPGADCEMANLTDPEGVKKVHAEYLAAGAQAIKTNTFGLPRMAAAQMPGWEELAEAGWKLACDAAAEKDAAVFADLGPAPDTEAAPASSAYGLVAQQFAALGAKNFLFETLSSDVGIVEAVKALRVAVPDAFVMVSFAVLPDGYTREGLLFRDLLRRMEQSGVVDAVGLNCVSAPGAMKKLVQSLGETLLPLSVMPNAGYPVVTRARVLYQGKPAYFAREMGQIAAAGVRILGGCCGTSPAYIAELKKALDGAEFVREERAIPSAVCSASNTVVINQPRIIGERINPTGKKLFKQALKDHNLDYIMNQALEQIDGGAEILDVNVGLPEIDERSMMVDAIRAIQSVCDVPLQIDSTIPEVLEAGLRIYCGKPIVNSVNGEENSLNNVLPLVKKYGACVVGLALDENGIPKTAPERVAIAKKILDRALAIGIPKENVFIDCLTLTASAEQDGVMETLNALHAVHYELGLNTVLGVSNISFGLPYRELVNQNFLAMALTYGLTLPIINPNVVSMTGAVRAYRLLTGIDRNSMDYIRAYNGYTPVKAGKQENAAKSNSASDSSTSGAPEKGTLAYAVENGLKNDGARLTAQMLEHMEALDIINGTLIPALDRIGKNFEKGKVFLPQLILAAEVTQASFEVIKKKLAADNKTPVSKGKIVMATVKGDVHDIGKNIVKVILENYGYTVIDLGKDVDYMTVVNAAIEHKAKLVGLSALMTTTLVSMEKTIELLHEHKVDCKIVVGGAVLTPEYAKQIGADYYAKDAMDTVAAAREVFGE